MTPPTIPPVSTGHAEPILVPALRAPSARAVVRRLFRQTVSSLLYEDALAVETAGRERVVHGCDADGRPVRYVVEVDRAVGFDRVRFASSDTEPPVRRIAPDGEVAEARSVSRFLDEVRASILSGAHPDELARFAVELEETRVKDCLAQYVRSVRGDVLAGAEHDVLEGTITDGHRYHPAYKSRIGFDLDDHVAFGPEFLPAVRPLWLAAHRSIAQVTTSTRLGEDRPDSFPRRSARPDLDDATDTAFDDRVRAAGHDPGDYVRVPVHPWQWRERLARRFADVLADGRLVVLGPDPAAFAPQQSIRTLSCRDEPTRFHLKLALSITNTSTSRGLAPHTVRNAAPISDWLVRIVERDPFLRDAARVVVLGERHGVSVAGDPEGELVRGDVEGTLAAIWRDPLAPRLDAGEQAVPVTGLTATELDDTPLVAPWLRRHGARAWVEAWVDAVAVPLVHLLVRHGVALESHAQNMSLVHEDGWPRRVALKDFHDGVRFCRRLLADPDDAPALAAPPAHHGNANSFVETDDPSQVTDFLLDAFFFVNAGELGLFLAEHDLLAEEEFWEIVARRVRAHEREHGTGTFDLFAPGLEVEKLTTRRIAPDDRLHSHRVSNPLHRFDPDRAREET